MSNVLMSLLSRVGLFKTVVAGAPLATSEAAHAAAVDAPAAPSHVGDSAAQVQTFDALGGLDGERVRIFSIKIGGPISPRSRYRWPHVATVNFIAVGPYFATVNYIAVPTPTGLTPRCVANYSFNDIRIVKGVQKR